MSERSAFVDRLREYSAAGRNNVSHGAMVPHWVMTDAADVIADLRTVVSLARAREAAESALAEHRRHVPVMHSAEEEAWWQDSDRLTTDRALAVAALRKALGEVTK